MQRDTSKSSYSSSVSTLVREAAASKSSLASVQSLQSQQSLGATEAGGLVRNADSDTVASVIERLHRIAPHLEGQWQRTMDMQELDDIINRVDRLDIGQKADWTIRRQEKVSSERASAKSFDADKQRRQVLKDALQQTSAQLERGLSDCPNDNIARANELREVSAEVERRSSGG